MTMVERVARALCVAAGHDPDSPTCDVFSLDDPDCIYPWAGFRAQARAAIEAMREPTDEMKAVVYWVENSDLPSGWRAMIDAALQE